MEKRKKNRGLNVVNLQYCQINLPAGDALREEANSSCKRREWESKKTQEEAFGCEWRFSLLGRVESTTRLIVPLSLTLSELDSARE